RHRLPLVEAGERVPTAGDLDHRPALGAERLEVVLLMLTAAAAEDLELGVVTDRRLEETLRDRAVELGQVLAGEEAGEIGGAEDEGPIDEVHGCSMGEPGDGSLSPEEPSGSVTPGWVAGAAVTGPDL